MNNLNSWVVSEKDHFYLIAPLHILDTTPKLSKEQEGTIISVSKSKDDPDLLWFSGLFCTGNTRNGNGDGFKPDVLKEHAENPVFKYVDWLHDESKKVGVIIHSEYIEEDKNNPALHIVGAIWQGTNYDKGYASKVKEHYIKGTMGLSMECITPDVECSVCGNSFPSYPENNYCQHLKDRGNNGATRWLKTPLFVGVGLIPAEEGHSPADRNAWVKEVASMKNKRKEGEDVEYTQEQLDKAILDTKKSFEDKISSLEEEIKEKEGEISVLEDSVKEKETEIMEISKLKSELEIKIKEHEEIVARKVEELFVSRVNELKELGYEIDDNLKKLLRDELVDDARFEIFKKTFVKSKETKKTFSRFESNSKTDTTGNKLREVLKKQ